MAHEMSLVQTLIEKYNTKDPFELCCALGFKVYTVPLNGVRGFCQRYARDGIIYISQDLEERDKRFVCAHELGHLLLHAKINTLYMDTCTYLKTNQYEQQADLFATCLLFPSEQLEEYEGWSANQISAFWGLPADTVIRRLSIRT